MKQSMAMAVSLALLSSLAQAQEASPSPSSTEQKQSPTQPTAAPVESVQEAPKPTPDKKRETISVTGTRIKRIDVETAQTVQTFDKEVIDRSGFSTVSDFVRNRLPSGGLTTENATLSQSAGSASFGGRTFDAEYTLVLVNGRRLPSNAIGDEAVDLNLIPLAAVEKIEYLTDGASAIYGSDAVAGVLNIITKKEFTGTSLVTRGGISAKGDGAESSLQIVTGTSSDRSNFLLAADLFKRERVLAKNRPYIKSTISPDGKDDSSPNGLPGYVIKNDGNNIPFADCPQGNIRPDKSCGYDVAPLYEAIPKSERQSIFTVFDHEITDGLTLFGEARFGRTQTYIANGPAPGPVALAASAPANPYGEDVLLVRRYLEFGPRKSVNPNESFNLTLGLKGSWAEDQNWEIVATKHRLRNMQVGTSGNVNKDKASQYFNDGTLNPFIYNSFDTADKVAAREDIMAETFRVGESNLETYALNLDGLLPVELPGGKIGYATGLEFREQAFVDRSDALSAADKIIGSAGGNGGGQQENKAVYLELSLPVVTKLDLSLATRFDRAGEKSATTYHSGVSYPVTETLKVRASYGTGFKAAGLQQRYLADSFGVDQVIDPVVCEKRGICTPIEVNTKSTGNPDLEPEKSVFWNMGLVSQLTESLSLNADLWSLKIKDQISALNTQFVLDNSARYQNLIKRSPADTLTVDDSFVQLPLLNLNKKESMGTEIGLEHSLKTGDATLNTNLKISRVLADKNQESPSDPLCDAAINIKGFDGNLTVDYVRKSYGVTGNVRYVGAYDSYEGGYKPGTCDYKQATSKFRVKPRAELDLGSQYSLPFGTELSAGIQNVLDTKPAYDRNEGWPWYSQGLYSNMGRFYYVQVGHNFN